MVYTNSNFNSQNKNRTATSLNKPKPQLPPPNQKHNYLKKPHENVETKEPKKVAPIPPKEKKAENPFLVSNPFYLDEEDKVKMESEQKEKDAIEREA